MQIFHCENGTKYQYPVIKKKIMLIDEKKYNLIHFWEN